MKSRKLETFLYVLGQHVLFQIFILVRKHACIIRGSVRFKYHI